MELSWIESDGQKSRISNRRWEIDSPNRATARHPRVATASPFSQSSQDNLRQFSFRDYSPLFAQSSGVNVFMLSA